MSIKGVYTALSGAMAQNLQMDTIANNIANVNTPGFKKDSQVFNEYLTANEKPPSVIQVPRIPASIESFYDLQGGDKSFVDAKGTFTDFSQGSLKHTGNQLDVAIDGKGFFEIATPTGVKLTRTGNFTLDGNGRLVTKEGFFVLKAGGEGEDPEARSITLNGALPLSINDAGDVLQGTDVIAKLSLVDVENKDSLQKVGNSMYTFKSNQPAEVVALKNPSVKSGFLESSNVNIVQEMTDMIKTQRIFESTQKAISAYDSISDKLVNQVGKTNG
ncbi:MAG: flagellar basal-body rod protein FlgF [Bdellovibrionaceae bacterium]|nr:flagellar basal-body rod protein FlgF [Pseudobdellovibrionaceae bacterium]